jgi:hypothetical protein
MNTLSISRINPPKFGGGLKFESDAEIEQKGAFCKGLYKRLFNFQTILNILPQGCYRMWQPAACTL